MPKHSGSGDDVDLPIRVDAEGEPSRVLCGSSAATLPRQHCDTSRGVCNNPVGQFARYSHPRAEDECVHIDAIRFFDSQKISSAAKNQ